MACYVRHTLHVPTCELCVAEREDGYAEERIEELEDRIRELERDRRP